MADRERLTSPRLCAVRAGAVGDVGALEIEVGHLLCGRWSRGPAPRLVDRAQNQQTIGERVVTVEQPPHRPPQPAAVGLAERPEERGQQQRAALLLAGGQRGLRLQRTPAAESSRMTPGR